MTPGWCIITFLVGNHFLTRFIFRPKRLEMLFWYFGSLLFLSTLLIFFMETP